MDHYVRETRVQITYEAVPVDYIPGSFSIWRQSGQRWSYQDCVEETARRICTPSQLCVDVNCMKSFHHNLSCDAGTWSKREALEGKKEQQKTKARQWSPKTT